MKNRTFIPGADLLKFQGPFRSALDIVLASASPRRQALLTSLGISFQVIPPRFKEPPPEPGRQADDYALFLAREKAREVAAKKPASLVMAADTLVVLGETIMGKPASEAGALDMLKRLQGNTHLVITAVCFQHGAENTEKSIICRTYVEMIPAEERVLAQYVKTGEPADKAGAYAIQGSGAFLVHALRGSYTNVVGLPLAEVCSALLEMNVIRLSCQSQP